MLDIKERLFFYEKMLDLFYSPSFRRGFCFALNQVTAGNYCIKQFPELMKRKPLTAGMFWWPYGDNQSRIDVLNQAIAECKKETSITTCC